MSDMLEHGKRLLEQARRHLADAQRRGSERDIQYWSATIKDYEEGIASYEKRRGRG
jgi:hypothetical protein